MRSPLRFRACVYHRGVRSRVALIASVLGVALASTAAHAAPDRNKPAPPPPSAASSSSESSQAASGVKASSEKSIDAKPTVKPGSGKRTQGGAGSSSLKGPGGKPAVNGPKIPDALREQLKKQLEARIDRDLSQIKQLRGEAITLLSTFVAETPKEAREMPEALLRLGELKWEQEREAFVERFKAWEAKPVDQRGPNPEPDFKPSRDLFARVLKDYPWFSQYDLALYVDGFLAYEQGKQEEPSHVSSAS